jgi:exosortase A
MSESVRSGSPDPAWLVAALGAALLVPVLGTSFGGMLGQWQTSTYSYGYLIAPVSLYFLWRDRQRLAALGLQSAWLPALLAAPLALAWVVAVILRVDVVHQLAAVALLVLLVWSVVGTPAAKLMLFPLGYLFLMVPLGDQLVPYLMRLTADVTVRAVQASGVPVYQDGFVFSLPSGNFEVVEACSGVRFLMAAVAAGAAFAHVVFQSNWKRLWFIVACMFVGVFGNLLRAYSVVMIAHLSDMQYGRDHETFGIILNGAVLLLFFLVAARFGDAPDAVASTGPVAANPPTFGPVSSPARRWSPAAAVAMLVVLAAAVPSMLVAWDDRAAPGQSVDTLAGEVPGWTRSDAAGSDWKPDFPTARSLRTGRFEPGAELPLAGAVDFAVATYALTGDAADLTSSVNQVHSTPWSLLGTRVVTDQEFHRREAMLQDLMGRRRLVWSWYRVGQAWTTSPVEAEWLTLRSLLAGEVPVREIAAVSVPADGDVDLARATLTAFAGAAGLGRTTP